MVWLCPFRAQPYLGRHGPGFEMTCDARGHRSRDGVWGPRLACGAFCTVAATTRRPSDRGTRPRGDFGVAAIHPANAPRQKYAHQRRPRRRRQIGRSPLQLLEQLSLEAGPICPSSPDTGLAVSTCHRLLPTFAWRGFVHYERKFAQWAVGARSRFRTMT
jgi:hypothetical protein